jgi:hypothetical protein
MPENAGVANLREFLDELAAVVLQTPANLPVLYPVGSLKKILNIRGVGPEAGLEFLRLGVLDGIVPEFNSQYYIISSTRHMSAVNKVHISHNVVVL